MMTLISIRMDAISSNTLKALYPEMNMTQAMDIAMNKMGELQRRYKILRKRRYAFRLVPVKKDDGHIYRY